MRVESFLSEKGAKTEQALTALLDASTVVSEELDDAMCYSLFAGGKRLRPALALGACELVSGDDAAALPIACALEMIHTYSLIHDDLPAMDDDDLRRGKPTSHKVYGEATAILAGDALLTMAFEVAARTSNVDVIRELAQAAGAAGMVGGQAIDLSSQGKSVDLETLRSIHRAKTGALIRASVRTGGMLGNADDAQLDALTVYGEQLGLAFQIADDVLDVTGDEAALGKPIGSDVSNDKATYPAVVGLEQARALADESAAQACAALDVFDEGADSLRALADYVTARTH